MEIVHVEPFLRSITELGVLGQDRYHSMLVAVTEAVNNAIVHGNKGMEYLFVEIDVRTSEAEIIATITDHGSGFDPNQVPDPRLPENLLRDGGRGVFLIQQLADVVEFYPTQQGTTVMLKYIVY